MKINCGESYEAKYRRLEEEAEKELPQYLKWHDFFPLWPRRVGENDCRWLETIERKFTGGYVNSAFTKYPYAYRHSPIYRVKQPKAAPNNV